MNASSVLVVADHDALRIDIRELLLRETRHVFDCRFADAFTIARCVRFELILVFDAPGGRLDRDLHHRLANARITSAVRRVEVRPTEAPKAALRRALCDA